MKKLSTQFLDETIDNLRTIIAFPPDDIPIRSLSFFGSVIRVVQTLKGKLGDEQPRDTTAMREEREEPQEALDNAGPMELVPRRLPVQMLSNDTWLIVRCNDGSIWRHSLTNSIGYGWNRIDVPPFDTPPGDIR